MSEHSPDLESPGSRYATRPGMAILSRSGARDRYDPERGDTGDASDVIQDAFGSTAPGRDALGEPSIIQGAVGRGASAWTPVIEWTVNVGIPALWPAAAWEAIRFAAKQARDLVSDLRNREAEFLVNRAYAALLATEYLLDESAEDGIIDVLAVEEPSSLGGRSLIEINYVGADPWIVLLLNEARTSSYIVAVSPEGSILGAIKLPVTDAQRPYLQPRPE